ncbi:MAG: ribose 5-phosphate isomerase B [Anaerolineaceae bacterium]|nr:ribose 5-phosphate isomerase B [Anaerolineaceae bacterium]MBN2678169.1 ribose 5-phosphate isomerase B [Anaerolineaceae bacterium]
MPEPTEEELHQIVQRVLSRTLGEKLPIDSTAGSDVKDTTESKPVQASIAPSVNTSPPDKSRGTVAIGTDHGGLEMKESLKTYLVELGYSVTDCGTNSKEAVDYPDFALAVAQEVTGGKAWRGILIDGAGIGSCMAANKVPGIRAALCYDYTSALNSREHNDANILSLGAGLIGMNQARTIVKTWLATDFLGGRHTRRVDKISAIEKQYLKGEK